MMMQEPRSKSIFITTRIDGYVDNDGKSFMMQGGD